MFSVWNKIHFIDPSTEPLQQQRKWYSLFRFHTYEVSLQYENICLSVCVRRLQYSTWDLLNDLIDLLHENLLQENQVVQQVCGQVVLKWTNLHAKGDKFGSIQLNTWCPVHTSRWLHTYEGAFHLSYTAQVVALEVVSLLCREVVRCPALVWVTLMLLHDVLSRHGDWRQGEAGWWRHGGHIHRGHFWLEAKLVVWQLKGETGLCPWNAEGWREEKKTILWLVLLPRHWY